MEDDLFGSIADHLRYYGYELKLEDGILKMLRAPPSQPYFWILPINKGATFRSLFKIGPAAKEDVNGFCKFLNQANQLAVVSRFVVSEDFMSVEAWFPPAYQREAFALFFNRYCADIAAPAAHDQQTVLRFFPLESPSTTP
jgi:hypothetical protein